MGFSRAAATGWMRGRMPSKANLAVIADYFGCTVDDLLADTKNAPTVKNDGRKTAEQELFDKLDPSDKAFILAWMAARVGGQPSGV